MQGIVYLRDTTFVTELGKTIPSLSQKDVFQHENLVDVKQLCKEREILEKYEENSSFMKARKRLLVND